MMGGVLTDIRLAARSLVKHRGVTLLAVLCLALGIGINTTTYTAAKGMALHPLPRAIREPGRLMTVSELPASGQVSYSHIAPATLADWRAASRVFEDLAGSVWWGVNLTGEHEPENVFGYRVTANFFSILGSRPLLGRTIQPGEDQAGHAGVVVLSHGLWLRRFAGDSTVVGRTVDLNGVGYTVIGVMPRDWVFPAGAALWVPLELTPVQALGREDRMLSAFGRLRRGFTGRDAAAEATAFGARWAAAFPASHAEWSAWTEPLEFSVGRGPRPYMLLMLVGVGFVVLIVCANVANLLLVRAVGRTREIAVRVALGAGRARIARQLLIESGVLALVGGALGLWLAQWGIELFALSIPAELRPLVIGESIAGVDGAVALYALGITLLTGLLFGLAPLRQAFRVDVQQALKEGSRGGGPGRHRLRGGLVVAETALALMLLVAAGLMVQSFVRLMNADLGFSPGQVMTLRLTLPPARYAGDSAVARFYGRLLDDVAVVPGVEAAAVTSILPMSWSESTRRLSVEGRPAERPGREPEAGYRVVSPGFFGALRVPFASGRPFTAADDDAHPRVAIVSHSLARRLWPGGGALGARLRIGNDSIAWEVVGVAADVQHNALVTDEPTVAVYVPLRQAPRPTMSLVVRTPADPAGVTAPVRRAIAALDPDLAPADVLPYPRVVALARSPHRATAQLMAAFAGFAVFLAAVGIYGVMATSVAERTHEIGVRAALGAAGGDVVRLIVSDAMRLAGLGLLIGTAAALGLARTLRALLFGVGPADPPTYAGVVLLLGGVALAASYLPARRAARLDPMVALRGD